MAADAPITWEVQHRGTLLFGLVSVSIPDEPPEPSPGSSDSSPGPRHEEDAEEEEDPTDDHSQGGTRSRSRSRAGARARQPSPSSDRSYQHMFAKSRASRLPHGAPIRTLLHSCELARFACGQQLPRDCAPVAPAHPCGFDWYTAGGDAPSATLTTPPPWPMAADLCAVAAVHGTPLVTLADGPVGFKFQDVPLVYSAQRLMLEAACVEPLAFRLPDLPPPSGQVPCEEHRQGWREGTAFTGRHDPPQHYVPTFAVPAPAAALGQPEGPYQASALIFVPEYTPEHVTVQLHPDIKVPEAIGRFQAAREEACVQRFDRLLPARPQPALQYAVFVSFADWHGGVVVLFDCTRYNGTMYSTLIPTATTKASLLSTAGIPPDRGVEVYAADYPFPLQEDETFEMQSGYCIHFIAHGQDPFAVGYFSDMLQSPIGWTEVFELPVLWHKWIYLVTDDEPCFFQVGPERRLTFRADVAAHLRYEPARPAACASHPTPHQLL